MKPFLVLAASTVLSGCVLDDIGIGGVGRNAVFDAQSVDEIVALGGIAMTDEMMLSAFSGQNMIEPNEAWTWEIREDGTQTAYDDNGVWADAPGGQWQVVNNQFCRENEDLPLKCSDVYQIGRYYRFTETDGSLALWTVTQG